MREGHLKLVRKFNQPWELYDMERDRTELHDLAPRNASLARRLAGEYDRWARTAGVVDWNIALPKLLSIWQMDNAHG